MPELIDFFTHQLSIDSASYIKYLRLERQLTFSEIYLLVTKVHSELKVKSELIESTDLSKGQALCTAAMCYLNDFENVDEWFW